jgi:hypothetical protein
MYPEHRIVLIGEPYTWNFLGHERIAYLYEFINPAALKAELNEYNPCLQFILAAYFCRDVDLLLHAISGFTLFIASIRPLAMKQPLPIFWGEKTFSGIDTCMEFNNWNCPEFINYRNLHPENEAFQYDIHHFLHFTRDPNLLKPYCDNFPNTVDNIRNHLYLIEKKKNVASPTAERIKGYILRALQYSLKMECHNLKRLETQPGRKNYYACIERLYYFMASHISYLNHNRELIEPDFYRIIVRFVQLAAKSLSDMDQLDTDTLNIVQGLMVA